MDLSACLNIMEEREIPCSCWESNHNLSVVQPVPIPTELSWHLGNSMSGVEFSGSGTTALVFNACNMSVMSANSFK
jgi:hypothetical protein